MKGGGRRLVPPGGASARSRPSYSRSAKRSGVYFRPSRSKFSTASEAMLARPLNQGETNRAEESTIMQTKELYLSASGF